MNYMAINNILEMLRRLPPQERLKVIAKALPEIEKDLSKPRQPRKSLLGICADLGPAPSSSDIDKTRKEVWKDFPREDI